MGEIDGAGAVGVHDVNIEGAVVSGNIAGAAGGGISHDVGTATLRNSIIAGNTAADCAGAVVSFDNNLDGNDTCRLVASNDLPGVDPQLDPLAQNGGPTQIHALLPGSPAINAGSDPDAPATDQRGFPRVGTSDMGAFELQITRVASPSPKRDSTDPR